MGNRRCEFKSEEKLWSAHVFAFHYSLMPDCQILFQLVPTARLELAQLSPLPPQDSVSTNFTTSARSFYLFAHSPSYKPMRMLPCMRPYFGISFDLGSGASVAGAGAAGALCAGVEDGAGSVFTDSMTLAGAFGLCVAK